MKLEEIGSSEQFIQAIEDVKKAYSTLLNNAVIVKVLGEEDLRDNEVKVFYKFKDQTYETSV
jgi:predicted alternative tryptophan synthase beta-subunit